MNISWAFSPWRETNCRDISCFAVSKWLKTIKLFMEKLVSEQSLKVEGPRTQEGNRVRRGKMPAVWFSLKRSLQCRSEPSDVYDPKVENGHLSNKMTKKSTSRSGCSRSISNLKDVIYGSKRYIEKPPSCSPRSIGSSEFLNPITHEVVFSDSACEIKISGAGSFQESSCGGGGSGSAFVGTLKPGTPGPGGLHGVPYRVSSTLPRITHRSFSRREGSGFNEIIPSNPKVSFGKDSLGASTALTCQKCGEQFTKWEAVESHHLSKHAVTELVEGDSSRKIVEMICRTGWLKSDNNWGHIERILKVHNMQKTIAQFEEYREMVKIRASKLQKKHPRCLADGNELLRFHGTTLECPLGTNGSSSLCLSDDVMFAES